MVVSNNKKELFGDDGFGDAAVAMASCHNAFRSWAGGGGVVEGQDMLF